MGQDSRWLIAAGIWFFTAFAGTWRATARLKDGIAFGRLESAATRALRRLQFIRWTSLLLVGGSIFAYWSARPFQDGVWWVVGISTVVVLLALTDALQVLSSWKQS